MEDLTRADQTVMLLTQPLSATGVSDTPTIDTARLAELETLAEQAGHDLGVYTTPAGQELLNHEEDADQIRRLLERGYTLGRRTEQWEQQGVSFICRTNPQYPARLLRRMGKEASPPALYCVGTSSLLETIQTAIVLPPNSASDMNKFAERLGKAAQYLGSTTASGADTRPERTLLAGATGQDSAAVGVVRGGLLRAAASREFKQGLANGKLLLISATNPEREDITDREAVAGNVIVHALAGRTMLVRPSSPTSWVWADLIRMPSDQHAGNGGTELDEADEEAEIVEADARARRETDSGYQKEDAQAGE